MRHRGGKEVKQRKSQTGEWVSFVVSGSMGGSAQSFIKGKCCQDAGRLKARRCRCDLCSRYGAINHPAFVSTGCRFCRRRRCCCCKTQPSLPHVWQAQTSKHAYAAERSKDGEKARGWMERGSGRQAGIRDETWSGSWRQTHSHTKTRAGEQAGQGGSERKTETFSSPLN